MAGTLVLVYLREDSARRCVTRSKLLRFRNVWGSQEQTVELVKPLGFGGEIDRGLVVPLTGKLGLGDMKEICNGVVPHSPLLGPVPKHCNSIINVAKAIQKIYPG